MILRLAFPSIGVSRVEMPLEMHAFDSIDERKPALARKKQPCFWALRERHKEVRSEQMKVGNVTENRAALESVNYAKCASSFVRRKGQRNWREKNKNSHKSCDIKQKPKVLNEWSQTVRK